MLECVYTLKTEIKLEIIVIWNKTDKEREGTGRDYEADCLDRKKNGHVTIWLVNIFLGGCW